MVDAQCEQKVMFFQIKERKHHMNLYGITPKQFRASSLIRLALIFAVGALISGCASSGGWRVKDYSGGTTNMIYSRTIGFATAPRNSRAWNSVAPYLTGRAVTPEWAKKVGLITDSETAKAGDRHIWIVVGKKTYWDQFVAEPIPDEAQFLTASGNVFQVGAADSGILDPGYVPNIDLEDALPIDKEAIVGTWKGYEKCIIKEDQTFDYGNPRALCKWRIEGKNLLLEAAQRGQTTTWKVQLVGSRNVLAGTWRTNFGQQGYITLRKM